MTKFDRNWKLWIGVLKERAELSKPVLIRRLNRPIMEISASADKNAGVEPQMGYVHLKGNKFIISISAIESKTSQLDTLLHEWAHCVAYPAQREAKTVWTHDELFGVAFAYVYRQFYQEPLP